MDEWGAVKAYQSLRGTQRTINLNCRRSKDLTQTLPFTDEASRLARCLVVVGGFGLGATPNACPRSRALLDVAPCRGATVSTSSHRGVDIHLAFLQLGCALISLRFLG